MESNSLATYRAVLDSTQIVDSLCLDSPVRTKCLRSWWYSIAYHGKKKQEDAKIRNALRQCMGERHGISDDALFAHVWKALDAQHIWSPDAPMTAGVIRTIDSLFKQRVVFAGPGIPAPSQGYPHMSELATASMRTLLHGDELPKNLERVLKNALVWKANPQLVQEARHILKQELENLATHPPKNAQEEFIWRAYFGNLLAILPFAYPHNGESIVLPVLDATRSCRRVEYSIQVMNITPSWLGSSMTALGITPKDDTQAPTLLTYLGTAYPTGDGFAVSVVFGDAFPGQSCGQLIYRMARSTIDQWIKDKNNIHVIGASLGGDLALHTLRHHHDKLARLDAYNPAGIYQSQWKHEYQNGCDIHIYSQDGDLVSSTGYWPTGSKVSLYHVLAEPKWLSQDVVSAHACAYTGAKQVAVLSTNPKLINRSFSRFLTTSYFSLKMTLLFPLYLAAFIIARLINAIWTFIFPKKTSAKSMGAITQYVGNEIVAS